MSINVAILGASDKPDRFSYKALQSLKAHGFNPIPINPKKDAIDGVKCYVSLRDVKEPVDTLTLYVRAEISSKLTADILALKPRRVIMNPGTENDDLADACAKNDIQVIEGCTLVMLNTGQF
ncbi:MAG TPA: CoA-binding protein [Armatimonadota bacterium]|jgi:hypothetical protein